MKDLMTPQQGYKAGLLDVLGVLFIALKLTNNIDWLWILVVSPFIVKMLLVFGIGVYRQYVFDKYFKR